MKTILHVIDTTGPGGAETIFIQLAKKIIDSNHKSIALIRGNGWVQSQLEELGVPFIVIDCKGSFNLFYLVKIIKIIFSYKIDLIQSHLLGSNVYMSIAGLLTGRRVISTFHGMVDISPNERFRFIKLLAIKLGSYRVVAVTDILRKIIIDLPLISPNKVVTIYNGIELEAYNKVSSPKLRTNLGLSEKDILIGSLGNIRTPKNYPLAINALKQLHDCDYKAHYAIAGQGNEEQMKPLIELAEKLKLRKYIHFLGFTKDTQDFLSSLDIFLMSSSSEGHPLALTQAMANKLPIATTRSGVELIVNNSEAELSDEMTADSLAKTINKIIINPTHAKQLANNAFSKAHKSFSLEKMFENYFKLYKINPN